MTPDCYTYGGNEPLRSPIWDETRPLYCFPAGHPARSYPKLLMACSLRFSRIGSGMSLPLSGRASRKLVRDFRSGEGLVVDRREPHAGNKRIRPAGALASEPEHQILLNIPTDMPGRQEIVDNLEIQS